MISSRNVFAALFALFSTTALTPLVARAQDAAPNPRIALVIGNATYKDKALATTANDAGLVAQTLQAAGFEVVGARDLDEKSLRTAMRDFLDKAAAAGPEMQAFVYLSGRGLQYDGDNYFVPVDAQINRDADVPIDSFRISDFAHALAATPGKARMIVLDAARANPYATQGAPLAPGLALVDPEPGELMAYNAAPGTLAGDEEGPYGVYGKTLAGAMRQGGVDIAEVFSQVRVTVNQQTQGAVIPWSASKLGAPYYVFERAADAPPPAVAAQPANQPLAGLPPAEAYNAALAADTMQGYEQYLTAFPNADQARRVRAILAARREAAFWRRSVNDNTPHAYWTYLRRYSHGPHVADARRRLTILSARYEPPADFQPMVYEDLPPPPPDEDFYESRPYYAFDDFGPPPPPPPVGYYYDEGDDWRDLPPPPEAREIGVLPVLGIAIPLVAGAIAYHHFHKDRDGVAPAGTVSVVAPRPFAPPELPKNVKPVAPAAPVAVAATPAGEKVVRPLPPIGPAAAAPGEKAPPAVPATAPAPGKTAATPTPIPAGSKVPVGAPTAPSATPATVAPGVKPLPVPAVPAATPTPAGVVKTPVGAPVVKPLPVPVVPATTPTPAGAIKTPAGAPVVPATPGNKALPVPLVPTPPAAGVLKNPVGAPKAPAALPTPTPTLAPIAPRQTLPPLRAPAAPALAPAAPAVHAPAAPVVRAPPPPAAPAPAPVVRAPPPPAPVYHAPAAAPVVRAPPPAPAPVMRAPPPAPAPVMRAPPPPAPAPVMRAPPPPAPVMRAPPPAAAPARPACGKPGLPPCPK